MISVSIVGGSGYTGGEALRLLLGHPHVRISQVTSESNAGKFVHSVHPNLRKRTDLKFVSSADIKKADLLFLCFPHGMAMDQIQDYLRLAERVIDFTSFMDGVAPAVHPGPDDRRSGAGGYPASAPR